jgi:hypothetical protein
MEWNYGYVLGGFDEEKEGREGGREGGGEGRI